jgi:DNA (cytosine-5)-methyltransferase 1
MSQNSIGSAKLHRNGVVKLPEGDAHRKPAALDFFAGSGLAAEALRRYFSVVWANDVSEKKALTYRANHPSDAFHLGSITEVSGTQVPSAVLSWASFPCQDLSLAGNLGGIESSRSGLVWQWLRVMDEMVSRPPLVVAENVLGLVSADGGSHYLALHNALRTRGYQVGAVLLDAAHWVPQSRPRVFVIGVTEKVDISAFEATGPLWCHNTAIQRVAAKAQDFVWWNLPEPKPRTIGLEDIVDFGAELHTEQTSEHILSLIPPAHQKRLDMATNGKPRAFPGYRRMRNGRQVLELRFDDIAGCLRTPEGGSSRQLLVIARNGNLETRLITIREAARLMGARESYRIVGSYNDGYKAMGDAVAVPAVRYLAQHLLSPLAQVANHE